ncbi:hypothetical protein AVEN_95286-1 [Araneus ventricosus]|uniref:Uncharacterized protein n=1 Tax=Araneus ventricosus TaxID=182803 RepID=A0A4Y2N529_ARAVE|nr:hypothetical protein AVEN_66347-1 [Araneus ventricosus]GBN33710.1 hypothetical protein AVEN_95286-1 [Araneus ventricosus]
MNRVYGEDFKSDGVGCECCRKFKDERTDVHDEEGQVCRNKRSCSMSSRQLLEQFKWDVSDHGICPDLATTDFHLFPELKN